MLIKRKLNTIPGCIEDSEHLEKIVTRFNTSDEPKEYPFDISIKDVLTSFDTTDVSHRVNNIKLENNILTCDIEFLDTPKGEVLKNAYSQDKHLKPNPIIRYSHLSPCVKYNNRIMAIGITITD